MSNYIQVKVLEEIRDYLKGIRYLLAVIGFFVLGILTLLIFVAPSEAQDLHGDNFELGNIDRWLPDFDTCQEYGFLPGCKAKITNDTRWIWTTPPENCNYKLTNGAARCWPKEFITALDKSIAGLWLILRISNNFNGPADSCLFVCNHEVHTCSDLEMFANMPLVCAFAEKIAIFVDDLESGSTRQWSHSIQ